MAKQRKLPYPSITDSFFDEMEREMSNVKRKTPKKEKPVPPEKLFLQFDPSKKEEFNYSKKTSKADSQPLLCQKAQWKPPIKIFSELVSRDLIKNMVVGNSNSDEKYICSNSNENIAKVTFLKDINFKTKLSDCVEESENKNHPDLDEENGDVIVITSSGDSSRQNPPETVLSTKIECSHYEDVEDTGEGEIFLGNQTETGNEGTGQSVKHTDIANFENKTVPGDYLKTSISSVHYKFNLDNPTFSSDRHFPVFQPRNAKTTQEECRDIGPQNTFKISDGNKCVKSRDVLVEGGLSAKDEMTNENELNSTIEQSVINLNVQPTKCSESMECQISKMTHIEADRTENLEKGPDDLAVINPKDILYQKELRPKELLTKQVDVEIAEQINQRDPPNEVSDSVNVEIENLQQNSTKPAHYIEEVVELQVVNMPLSNVASNPATTAKLDFLIENNSIKENEIECENISPRNNHTQINKLSETTQNNTSDPQFQNLSTTETHNSSNLEITLDPNRINHSNDPSSMEILNYSRITTACVSTIPDVDSQNSLQNDYSGYVSRNSGHENSCIQVYENVESKPNQEEENKSDHSSQNCETLVKPNHRNEENKTDHSAQNCDTLFKPIHREENKTDCSTQNCDTLFKLNYGEENKTDHKLSTQNCDTLIEPNHREENITDHSAQNCETLVKPNHREENKTDCSTQNCDTLIKLNHEEENKTDHCIQNYDTLKKDFTVNEVVSIKLKNCEEFDQTLQLKEKGSGEKVAVDEDYSCLMITDSQLEEIERNYYETANKIEKVDKPKVSGNNEQGNESKIERNQVNYDCSNTKEKAEGSRAMDPQNKFTSRNTSKTSIQNVPPKLPSEQWSKNMLDMKKKIRDLIGEVEHLNSLLRGFRQEFWPQNHRDNRNS